MAQLLSLHLGVLCHHSELSCGTIREHGTESLSYKALAVDKRDEVREKDSVMGTTVT